jgi:hypothetical protein
MAGFGIPHDDIGLALQIDAKTLRRHYRIELDTGHIRANAKVAQNLFRLATGEGREAVTAAMFWLKTRAGWSEYMAVPRPVTMGKKETADIEAATAAEGTHWSDLIRH